MTTAEKNAVIAQFMGLETGKELGYDRWHQDWFDNRGVINGQRNTNLLFDSDWNWLMLATERIEDLNYDVKILGGCWVIITDADPNRNESEDIVEVSKESKILSLHEAVFQFIQWYNQQKQ